MCDGPATSDNPAFRGLFTTEQFRIRRQAARPIVGPSPNLPCVQMVVPPHQHTVVLGDSPSCVAWAGCGRQEAGRRG